MIADYYDGEQKMLDKTEFTKSLKISWILKYLSDDCKSKWEVFLFYFHLSKFGGKLVFCGNLGKKDAIKLRIEDVFLQEVNNIVYISELIFQKVARRFQVKGRRSLQFKVKTGNKFNPLRSVKLEEGLRHLIHQHSTQGLAFEAL